MGRSSIRSTASTTCTTRTTSAAGRPHLRPRRVARPRALGYMPISIWNDRPYDEDQIWSGSATIVDGKVRVWAAPPTNRRWPCLRASLIAPGRTSAAAR